MSSFTVTGAGLYVYRSAYRIPLYFSVSSPYQNDSRESKVSGAEGDDDGDKDRDKDKDS
jgi:hypothetical protein